MRVPLLVVTLALMVTAGSAAAQQPSRDAAAWRAFAQTLGPGAAISVRTRDGVRLRGTLVQQLPEGILIQPKTRLPVPMRVVAFGDIDALEQQKPGMSAGLKVTLGVGIGVGVAALLAAITSALSY